MFNKHLLLKQNGEEVLYLFINYNYEFSKIINNQNKNEKETSIYYKIKEYIKDKNIVFNGTKVFLVVNGIIMGSFIFTNPPYQNLNTKLIPKYKYIEHIENFDKPKLNIENIFNNIETKEKQNEPTKDITKQPTKIETNDNTTEETIDNTTNETNDDTTEETNDNTTNEANDDTTEETIDNTTNETNDTTTTEETIDNTTNETNDDTTEETIDNTTNEANDDTTTTEETIDDTNEKIVTIYRFNGSIEEMNLEDYIIGVVSAEMPAAFHNEALKAQAVAARTYALKTLSQNKILTDNNSTQSYKDINQLKSYWGNNFNYYYNKIKDAVFKTKGEYIAYNNNYIDAVYHSTSNCITENSIDVWGNSFPYLKSTNSPWDKESPSYISETTKELDLVNKTLGININEESNIKIVSKTEGDNIDIIKIDNLEFSGKELREKLGLRSTDFDIKIQDNKVTFTTRGYGHGVGMSQYGANGMAKDGYNYKQILTHYYQGTNIANR